MCNSFLFGLPANLFTRLQSVQNAAARLIFRIRRSQHITPALISLHWLRVQTPWSASPSNWQCWRTDQSTALYLAIPTVVFHSCHRHDIKTTAAVFCLSPSITTRSASGRSQLPAPWNDLPLHVTSAQSLAVFRQRLKTFLFSRSYPDILIWITYYYFVCFFLLFFWHSLLTSQ